MSVLPALLMCAALLGPSAGLLMLLGTLIRGLRTAPRFVSLTALWLWGCGAVLIAWNVVAVVRFLWGLASSVDANDDGPTAKARLLAEVISLGMNFTALTVPVILVGLAWVLVWRWKLARRP